MSPNQTIPLTAIDLGIASVLVILAGVISVLLKLHLERELVIASLRTVVQLMIVGYVLRFVFGMQSPIPLLIVVLLMVTAATQAAVTRPKRRIAGSFRQTFITLALCGILITLVATQFIIGAHPWYDPRYVIPLLGMVIGNSMTAVSLCLDFLLESFSDRRAEIEMDLSLGATAWEAAREPVAEAVRRGMIPIINAMSVVGLVSLPGMMTGQILAGADPISAVKYQIMIMFMLAASTSLTGILTALFVYRKLFNNRHQLKSSLIRVR